MKVNNKVFLHELDCSMESEYEIKRGQWALYDQIVNKGNIVVLSYFEVIDSCSFYSLYNSSPENKEAILSLFKSGRIKLNGYKDRRTPAQCLIEQINIYIKKNKFPYLFSVLDNNMLARKVFYIQEGSKKVRKYKNLLSVLKRAIIYSDPELIKQIYFKSYENENGDMVYFNEASDKDFLDFLEKYVRMVLEVSSIGENIVDYQGKINYLSFNFVYKNLKHYIKTHENLKFNDDILWIDILDRLEKFKKKIKPKYRNNREQWYIQIGRAIKAKKNIKDDYIYLCKDVVDSIYNMTVESSVRDVLKDYKDDEEGIFKEIEKHVLIYYNDAVKNNHWHVDKKKDLEKSKIDKHYISKLNWQYAAFLFDTERFKPRDDKNWRKTKIIHSILSLIKSSILIVSFYAIPLLNDLLMRLPLKILQIFVELIQEALKPVVSIFISDLIGKILEKTKMTGADSLKYSLANFFQKVKFLMLSLKAKNKNEMEYSKS